jgi:hypothetical protein
MENGNAYFIAFLLLVRKHNATSPAVHSNTKEMYSTHNENLLNDTEKYTHTHTHTHRVCCLFIYLFILGLSLTW